MKTVLLGEPPLALVSLLAERKRLGLDTHDEVWNGDYHMAPAAQFEHGHLQLRLGALLDERARSLGFVVGAEFNLGHEQDFRVPDLGVHRGHPSGVWFDTAAIVVGVRSPDDETYEKFGFFFDHDVEEVLVVDLNDRSIRWFARADRAFVETNTSTLLGFTSDDIRVAIDW